MVGKRRAERYREHVGRITVFQAQLGIRHPHLISVRPPPRLLDVDLAAKVFDDSSREHNSLTVVLAVKLAASSGNLQGVKLRLA